jgi:hypothetical protein
MNATQRAASLGELRAMPDEEVVKVVLDGFVKQSIRSVLKADCTSTQELGVSMAACIGAGFMSAIDMCNVLGLERMARIQVMIDESLGK